MLKTDAEITDLSNSTLEEEITKAQRDKMYFEMADGPQYYQAQEVRDRNKNLWYLSKLSNELKKRKTKCQNNEKI